MSRLEQFRKLQESRAKQKTTLREVSDPKIVDAMLNSDIDEKRLSTLDYSSELIYSIDIDEIEAQQLLTDLRNQFNSDRVEKLLSTVQKDIFQSIAGPSDWARYYLLMIKLVEMSQQSTTLSKVFMLKKVMSTKEKTTRLQKTAMVRASNVVVRILQALNILKVRWMKMET